MIRKQKSIKLNFIINGFRVVFNILFPLIVFPYVSRILMPEGVGRVDFATSVIAYFIMLSSLGIPLYGIRECAKVRDTKEKLSKIVHELFMLSAISTAISYLLFVLCILFIPRLRHDRDLLILISSSILFTTLGVEWLYQALEEYAYITMRSIGFKFISLIGLFLLVNSKDDYALYAGIMVFSSVGSNILNVINVRKYISLKRFDNYNLKPHIKPILTLFSMNLAISIYANLDTIMLGSLTTNYAVGLYTASVKMSRVVITLVTSLSTVLLPRLSYFIEHGIKEEFDRLIYKSIYFIMFVSLPCILFLFVYSDKIILLLAGEAYMEAVPAMRILLPVILVIALSNLVGIQVLIPMGMEKTLLYSVIFGAIANFGINLILIPRFSQNGAAIGSLVAESVVTLSQFFFAWYLIKKAILSWNLLKYLGASLIMLIVLIPLQSYTFSNTIITLLISASISGTVYILALIILKDDIVYDTAKKIIMKKVR